MGVFHPSVDGVRFICQFVGYILPVSWRSVSSVTWSISPVTWLCFMGHLMECVSPVTWWSMFHLSLGVFHLSHDGVCFSCHMIGVCSTCQMMECFTCHLMECVSPVSWWNVSLVSWWSVFYLSIDGVCCTCHLMECVSLVSWWSVFHLLVDGVCFTCHLMEISVHVLNIGIQLDQRNVETA